MSKITGTHAIQELHTITTRTSEGTDVKLQDMENNITRTTNCNYKVAATVHTLETLFVLGI